MSQQLLIGLDADGVLVHYNKAYGAIWNEFFQTELTVVEPNAYHATTYWGVEDPPRDSGFWELFKTKGWRSMVAMDGAVEACQRLHEAGHRLVCVTSMPEEQGPDRHFNLQALGFPIDEVIATGHSLAGNNPKKEAIDQLKPHIFVDDELRKLKDLEEVRCFLIDPIHPDSPNEGKNDDFIEARLHNLTAFADYLLGPAPQLKRSLSP